MRLAPDFELRLARLNRDLTQLQRSVQELLGTFDRPRVDGRRRNPAESVQYAVLEAALRTSEATLSQLRGEGEGEGGGVAGEFGDVASEFGGVASEGHGVASDGADGMRARPARAPSRSRALRT